MTEPKVVNPEAVRSADIVVGIPSLNEAAAIGYTTEQVSLGLTTYFPDMRVVIVNCDNASADGTREAFFAAPCQVPRIHISSPPGVTGKGNNLRNLFKIVRELKATAAVSVDADIRSISPKWIKSLCEPLLSDYAYVTPIYLRHKYDGAITNNLVYPLTRCLYGRRVRQPIGGDFGFSGELAGYFLESGAWTEEAGRYGIDVWMTTLAMVFGKPITQAYLGTPKLHREMSLEAMISGQFKDVVGTVLKLQEQFSPFWKSVRRSKPTAIFGFGLGDATPPVAVNVDTGVFYSMFVDGALKMADVWREVLTPPTLAKLNEVLDMGMRDMEMPAQLWARCLFDFSVSYRDRIFDAGTLINALAPIYFGKTVSFVRATEGMGMQQTEELIEEECLAFEESKSYLLEKWGA